MISSLQYCILCKQTGELSVYGYHRGGVCLFPITFLPVHRLFAVCVLNYCTRGGGGGGVPFLHAPFRQRVGLGLGPMRGQGTKARRAAGRNGTPELWGGGGGGILK